MSTKEIVLYSIIAAVVILAVVLTLLLKRNYNNYLKQSDDIDKLTGLYTYDGIIKKFKDKAEKQITILSIDIKSSHALEEQIGRQSFENIIIQIAGIVKSKFEPKYRMGAHFSSDVFSIAFQTNDVAYVTSVASEMTQEIDRLGNDVYEVNVNYGIAVGPENSVTLERSLLALKYAKRKSKETLVYSEDIQEAQGTFDRISADPSIINSEFAVYYQPKVNATTGEIVGAEALVRWIDENGNVIMYPDQFISEFESNGLIIKLDLFVLDQVCQFLESMNKRNQKDITISMNFSRIDFTDPDLITKVNEIVSNHIFKRELLHIEVTENAYVKNNDMVANAVVKLNELGIAVEMDDFGSGYSSIATLMNSRFSVVKMDRFFVENNLKLNSEQVFLESLVKMFVGINLGVTVEGVESAYVVRQIRKMAPNILIQGFYFFKPMSVTKFERILQDSRYVLDDIFKEEVDYEEKVKIKTEYIYVEVPKEEEKVEEPVEEPIEEIQEEIIEDVIEEEPIEEIQEEIVEEVAEEEPVEEEDEGDLLVIDESLEDENQESEEERIIRIIELYKQQYRDEWEAEINKKYPELMKKHYERKLFMDKLSKLDATQVENYNILKNAIMSHTGIKNRTTKYFDTFIHKTSIICKLGVVGKSIRLYLALNPDVYPIGQYPHKDVSDVKRHQKTPYLMKISSGLSVRRGLKLLGDLFTNYQLDQKGDYEDKDYVKGMRLKHYRNNNNK